MIKKFELIQLLQADEKEKHLGQCHHCNALRYPRLFSDFFLCKSHQT